MRPKIIIASLATLSLSIVSTTFVLLALTSKEWSIQNYYESSIGGGSPIAWTDPVCVAHRSPFYRCGIPNVTYDAVKNVTTCNVPDCAFYKPYGRDQTSCRLPVETGTEDDPLDGTAQECQEVHYAGNLQIAASFFLTFSLVLLIPLTMFNFVIGAFSGGNAREKSEQSNVDRESEAQGRSSSPSHHYPKAHSHHERLSPWTPYLALILLLSLYTGAILQILAQFFAILALTINATPSPAQATQNGSAEFGASAWTMDKALTAYATVAWTTALACALLTGYLYRTPRFAKLV